MFAQMTIISENFDNYISGNTITSSNPVLWETWSGGSGTIQDALITDVLSSSSSNSMNVHNNAPAQWFNDVVMVFPSVYTTGIYELRMKIFIPSGSGANFNAGSQWSTNGPGYEIGPRVVFNGDGSGNFQFVPFFMSFTYSQDEWTDISLMVNLDVGNYALFINSNLVWTDPWSPLNGFGAINIWANAYSDVYATTPVTSNFYVDDIELLDWTNLGVEEYNISNVSVYPNPALNSFTIEGLNKPYDLSISNSIGQVLYTENSISDTSKKIDVSSFESGLIFIRIESEGSYITKKVIIK